MTFSHTSCLGSGVIGASWAALFLASGKSVSLYDPAADSDKSVKAYIETAWPTLERLGLAEKGNPDNITFCESAAEAVEGADFIQENVPERIAIKHATFAEIEPALKEGAIVASSASGLTLSQMQDGWQNPSHFVLGHPFNPPHLIPLVEVLGNDKTAEGVVESARAFYESIGKITIRLNKEKNGHVANRLQAAIWREAISLVAEGVASVEDVDKAVWAGPGLRWATMGPTGLFHLGAGAGGLPSFLDHFTDTFNGWWDDLGQVYLDDEIKQKITEGMSQSAQGKSVEELAKQRDAMLVAIQEATRPLRNK